MITTVVGDYVEGRDKKIERSSETRNVIHRVIASSKHDNKGRCSQRMKRAGDDKILFASVNSFSHHN